MFRPLFPEHFCMMVRLGLARSRVQPFLEINQLRATSFELRANRNWVLMTKVCPELAAHGSKLYTELREAFGNDVLNKDRACSSGG